MRRTPLLALALVVAAASFGAPAAAQSESDDVAGDAHDIVFPVVGEVEYRDTFGEPRDSGRTHQGQDIFAPKMQQLVAVDSGVLSVVVWPEASYGYYVKLTADDGWTYSYVHLNDDTPGTDDGAAEREDVYGPGIEQGARVERGQLLAYVGDSGNAENTPSHVHFEMRDAEGALVNPMASLDAAERLDAPVGDAIDSSPIPRLAGADRTATAVAVAERGWPDGAGSAVLAAGDVYAEALPASVLAAAEDSPLLLVGDEGVDDDLEAELDRLDVSEVTVIGSVPPSVDDALKADGRRVRRIGTAGDPTATAVEVATAVGGDAGVVVLVNRDRFADGVSAAALAAGNGWPILLTTTSIVPQATVDAWRDLGAERIVLLGGTGVIAANIEAFIADRGRCAGGAGCEVERIAGADRYATSVAAAEASVALGKRSVASLLLGTGTNYPDTLAAGPLADRLDGIAVLVDGTGAGNDAAAQSYLRAHADEVDDVVILGGSGAVTSTADRAIQEALGLDDTE